jgi:hypothetical protein
MRRLAVLLVLALLGCETEMDQSTRPEHLPGTYTLQSWGGRSLPTVFRETADAKDEITGGRLTVSADRTWSQEFDVRETSSSGAVQTGTLHDEGGWSYVRDYTYLLFTASDSSIFSGVPVGGTITLQLVSGEQLVYKR